MVFLVYYIPNCEKSLNTGIGIVDGLKALYVGTFLHSKLGSGHLLHGMQGGHFETSNFSSHFVIISGHFGHTGGTTSDFKMYKSSCPEGIKLLGMP